MRAGLGLPLTAYRPSVTRHGFAWFAFTIHDLRFTIHGFFVTRHVSQLFYRYLIFRFYRSLFTTYRSRPLGHSSLVTVVMSLVTAIWRRFMVSKGRCQRFADKDALPGH